ncbi:hypothetical protein ACSSS7_004015 [Eimeria intestinalis]
MEKKGSEDACSLEPLDASRFPWLFWGDRKVARNEQLLRRQKITYIINCTPPCGEGGVPNFHERALWGSRNTFRYLRVPVYDTQAETLQPHFEVVWEFMETCRSRQDGNVLIHCNHGVSRSVAFVCSYLIRFEGMSCDEALAFVRKRNPLAKPNDGFRNQLKQLHERVLKESRSGGSEPRQMPRGAWVPPPSCTRKRVMGSSLPAPRPRSKVLRRMGPLRPPQLVAAAPSSGDEASASAEARDLTAGAGCALSVELPSPSPQASEPDAKEACRAEDEAVEVGDKVDAPICIDLTASCFREGPELVEDTATTTDNTSPLGTPRALSCPDTCKQSLNWASTPSERSEPLGCKDTLEQAVQKVRSGHSETLTVITRLCLVISAASLFAHQAVVTGSWVRAALLPVCWVASVREAGHPAGG